MTVNDVTVKMTILNDCRNTTLDKMTWDKMTD